MTQSSTHRWESPEGWEVPDHAVIREIQQWFESLPEGVARMRIRPTITLEEKRDYPDEPDIYFAAVEIEPIVQPEAASILVRIEEVNQLAAQLNPVLGDERWHFDIRVEDRFWMPYKKGWYVADYLRAITSGGLCVKYFATTTRVLHVRVVLRDRFTGWKVTWNNNLPPLLRILRRKLAHGRTDMDTLEKCYPAYSARPQTTPTDGQTD